MEQPTEWFQFSVYIILDSFYFPQDPFHIHLGMVYFSHIDTFNNIGTLVYNASPN